MFPGQDREAGETAERERIDSKMKRTLGLPEATLEASLIDLYPLPPPPRLFVCDPQGGRSVPTGRKVPETMSDNVSVNNVTENVY